MGLAIRREVTGWHTNDEAEDNKFGLRNKGKQSSKTELKKKVCFKIMKTHIKNIPHSRKS